MERVYIQRVLRLEDAARGNFSQAAFEATPKYAELAYSDVSLGAAPLLAGCWQEPGADLVPPPLRPL